MYEVIFGIEFDDGTFLHDVEAEFVDLGLAPREALLVIELSARVVGSEYGAVGKRFDV